MLKVDFTITFWGVRGSYPVPGPDTVLYGGNTPCVQVQIGERLLILDAGTGICNLGRTLSKEKVREICGDIFITHAHWDHIQGFPFFSPAFRAGNTFTLYGTGCMDIPFSHLIKNQMGSPHFPVDFEDMNAAIEFREVMADETLDIGDGIIVKTAPNNHPNGGISFRIEHANRVLCYLVDTEHYGEIDRTLVDFSKGADVVIYDANFTDREYLGVDGTEKRIGWGHSTWQEGIKLVKAAGAKKLVLFHHNAHRTDAETALIEKAAQEVYQNSCAAREGMVIRL